MRLLVCGGAGFIGSTFARLRRREHGDRVTVLDKLTYAGREENLHDLPRSPASLRPRRDRGRRAVAAAIDTGAPEAIVNFAAETHVDRSIAEPDAFVTHARARHLHAAGGRARHEPALPAGLHRRGLRLDRAGSFTEDSPLRPSSPYSATKTGADLLVQSYFHTYGLPALDLSRLQQLRPYQYPEKLIPLMVLNALHGDRLPVYGDGMQVRNWIHVLDFARAIGACARHGLRGRGLQRRRPRRVRQHRVVKRILELIGARRVLIEYVTDRPGHDRRYSLSSEKVPCAWLGATGALRRGPRGDRRLVSRERLVVGADPLGDYREYYQRQYGRLAGLIREALTGTLTGPFGYGIPAYCKVTMRHRCLPW